MGNRNNQLSWTWPLISIEWVPDILSVLDNIIEPSWIGLSREMTNGVVKKSFSMQLFSQLKTLLTEAKLVEQKGRYILTAVEPKKDGVQKHLLQFYNDSVSPWATYFKRILNEGRPVNYTNIQSNPPELWYEINSFPVFKQWAQFFNYLGIGFLINSNTLLPETAITEDLINDIDFVSSCLKSNGDPRKLTGKFSFHTESDYLSWTKGEDYLPISNDRELFPRIPHEKILNAWEENKGLQGSWCIALNTGRNIWERNVSKILAKYPFSDLEKFIYTCKTFIDYFIFGEMVFDTDLLESDKVSASKLKWGTIKHFSISKQFWRNLPNFYKDITRLFWGISYFRNSLRNPSVNSSLYDESLFNSPEIQAIKDIPIKCYRSKRTLNSIYKTINQLIRSVSRLVNNRIGDVYENRTKKLTISIKEYFPSNAFDTLDIIVDLGSVINISESKKRILLN